ncbi:MAG: outer membrane beta-barrel protein [bacterium]
MKKLLLFLLFSSVVINAQFNSAAIKLGYFSPGVSDGGFIIGYEGGKYIDENFRIGWSLDWFHKKYIDKTLVGEFNAIPGALDYTVNELRAETNLHQIPLMFTMTGSFPVAPRWKAFATASLGFDMLLIVYNSYENTSENDIHAAFDFSWRLGGGMVYQLGSRSELFGEITYHNSKPSWTYEVTDANTGKKHTFEREFDMSGFLTRVGVRFYY